MSEVMRTKMKSPNVFRAIRSCQLFLLSLKIVGLKVKAINNSPMRVAQAVAKVA